MKELIDDLKSKRIDAENLVKNYNDAIKSLQKVCSHKNKDGSDAYEYDGHDSHNDYYKCSICGYEN